MPYYKISGNGREAVCHEGTIESAKDGAKIILGPGEYEIEEITEDKANELAGRWDHNPEDLCPICEGPRSLVVRGEIVLKHCPDCETES